MSASAKNERGANLPAGDDEPRSQPRPVTYCLIPAELSAKLHEPLRRHFLADPAVRVVVEHRGTERRGGGDRRQLADELPAGEERRRIRQPGGRRVAERRAVQAPVEAPRLPRAARRHAERLTFFERLEPSTREIEDAESKQLVIRLQAGEAELFKDLYLRYFEPVYEYMRAVLRDQHEAEDVSQQVFTSLLETLPRYEVRPGTPFRAWLFRIAHNEAVNHFRRQRLIDIEEPAQIQRRREQAGAEELSLDWLSDTDLLVLFERLPATQRQVLTLRYVLGLTNEEIAIVTDSTPQAVGQLHYRARTFLAERLHAVRARADRTGRRSSMLIRLRRMPVLGSRRGMLAPTAGSARRGANAGGGWRR